MTPLGREQQKYNRVLQKFTREIIDRRVAEYDDKPTGEQVCELFFILFKFILDIYNFIKNKYIEIIVI